MKKEQQGMKHKFSEILSRSVGGDIAREGPAAMDTGNMAAAGDVAAEQMPLGRAGPAETGGEHSTVVSPLGGAPAPG